MRFEAGPKMAAAASANSAEVSTAGTQQSGMYRIVAIGDSLTAGYEPGMENVKNPVPYGYADRVYEQALFHGLRTEFANYGVLGLSTEGLQNWLNSAQSGSSNPAADEIQSGIASIDPRAERIFAATAGLRSDLMQASLVVVTIGGNNFTPLFNKLKDNEDKDVTDQWLSAVLDEYASDVEAALRSILQLNAKAQIVVADQYLPITKYLAGTNASGGSNYDYLNQGRVQIKERLSGIAEVLSSEGYNVKVASVGDAFAGHESEYTNISNIGKRDIHPTQTGYSVMGREFASAIWGDYIQPSPRPANVPISVVVSGKELGPASKPIVKNNTTYVPMRDIAIAAGADLKWSNKTRTASVKLGGREVAFTIGSKSMKVDGKAVPLTTPAFLQQSAADTKTYLPLAALSRGLDLQVVYRSGIKTVFINR
ncbi:hypothetical protein VN24_23785 [Paenibacillus beijingensis]|uniref:Copper amine oxidase-like N-terminal domain-containing protein n=1 Tax=Paenibacillus beijingensis TaxID=1126833 RepID=A0A0D5NRL8_9BACL|nr:hypothetical protein VN24_23785 [Paenibacillus beijingensis]